MDLTNARIEPLSLSHIDEIIAWEYEGPYAIYNLEKSDETVNNFLNNDYFVMLTETNELIGFYCYGAEATIPYGSIYQAYDDQGYVDIGLGMNPKYVSQGLGFQFLKRGLDYLSHLLGTNNFRLSVLESNIRGRKLYSKIGFKVKSVFPSNINNNHFIVMIKE